MSSTLLPPLKPLPMKDRISMVFVQYGQIDVLDGAFVVIDKNGVRTHIPLGSVACIMLEPGTRISHAAVNLAATVGTLLVWVGESGVRLYSSGQPGGARADRLLYQARLALDDELRLKVVRKMYEVRFGEPAPAKRSVEQLRGIEGARVRGTYKLLAQQYQVNWQARNYDRNKWDAADIPNRCLSAATACLYGITEAAVLAAGYAPAVVLFTQASRCRSSTTLLTCTNSTLWYRWPFASPPSRRLSLSAKCAWPAAICSAPTSCSVASSR